MDGWKWIKYYKKIFEVYVEHRSIPRVLCPPLFIPKYALFQKGVVCTKLDIYIFISPITTGITRHKWNYSNM